MKIGNPTDFWGGSMFAVIGALFAIVAYGVKFGDSVLLAGYAMGTPARMGPGFFPFWLGVILMLIGISIAFTAVVAKHGKPLEKFHWGPVGWVLGAVCVFGFLMKPLGMLISGVLLVVIASFGSHDFKWKPVIILGICLSVFSALIFAYGLKLPIPLCPDVESLQQMSMCRG
jgi:hypothetical protein